METEDVGLARPSRFSVLESRWGNLERGLSQVQENMPKGEAMGVSRKHDKKKPFRWDVCLGTIEVLQTELGMLSDHRERRPACSCCPGSGPVAEV